MELLIIPIVVVCILLMRRARAGIEHDSLD